MQIYPLNSYVSLHDIPIIMPVSCHNKTFQPLIPQWCHFCVDQTINNDDNRCTLSIPGCQGLSTPSKTNICMHDDVIKWKHFPRYWPFVRRIHRSPVNSLHKGQWRGAFMFSLIYAQINLWVNNREAGDLRRYRAHYDVIVMIRLCQDSEIKPNMATMGGAWS